MEDHFKRVHPEEWKTLAQTLFTMCPSDVWMQTIFLGNKTRFFRVLKQEGVTYKLAAPPFFPANRNASTKGDAILSALAKHGHLLDSLISANKTESSFGSGSDE